MSHETGAGPTRATDGRWPARLLRWGVPALAVWMLTACATKSDVHELRTFIQQEMATLRDSVQVRIGEIQRQLDRVETGQKDLIVGRSSELERRIAELHDQLDQLTALVAQTRQQMDRQLQLLSRSERASGAAATAGDTAGAPSAEGAAAGDVGQLYRAAREQMGRGAYGTAREAFTRIVTQHPDHELAPDAQFYLAQTFQEEGDLERALQEYTAIMELYPNSPRAPASLFQRALVQLDRGNTAEARTLLQRILRGYPDSPEAGLAARRLEEIGQG